MARKIASNSIDVQKLQVNLIVVSLVLTVLLGYASGQSFLRYQGESQQLRRLEFQHSCLERDADRLEKLLVQYTREQEKFQDLLFKEQDVPLFLEEIARIAVDAKVKILDMKTRKFVQVSYSDPVKAEKEKKAGSKETGGMVLSSLPVVVNIQGTFESIVNFLIQLEKYKQLLTLSDVDIRVKEYPQLSCTLTVSIYSLREMKTELTQ